MSRPVKKWLYGLASGFIGGGASAVGVMYLDNEHFNLANIDGVRKVFEVMLVSGTVSAIGFLRQSPLPPLDEEQE